MLLTILVSYFAFSCLSFLNSIFSIMRVIALGLGLSALYLSPNLKERQSSKQVHLIRFSKRGLHSLATLAWYLMIASSCCCFWFGSSLWFLKGNCCFFNYIFSSCSLYFTSSCERLSPGGYFLEIEEIAAFSLS